jgi:hypothetical protein
MQRRDRSEYRHALQKSSGVNIRERADRLEQITIVHTLQPSSNNSTACYFELARLGYEHSMSSTSCAAFQAL